MKLWVVLAVVVAIFALANHAAAQEAQANLSWTAPQFADSYVVQRSQDGGPYAQVGTPTSTTFVDAPLSLSVLYCWQVAGVNTFGTGAFSAPACGRADAPGQVLGVQVILSPAN